MKATRQRNQSHFSTDRNNHQIIQWANVSTRIQDADASQICECFNGSKWLKEHGVKRGILPNIIDGDIKHVHWDKILFEYGPGPLCASGGFGAAKTYPISLKALLLSDTYPFNRGVICRKVAKELERTTQATFFKICPPAAYDPQYGGRRADSENYLRLARSESEILWLHLDDPDIEGVIRGLEINWFFIDQAEEIPEEVFDMLCSRLGRWDKCIVPEAVMLRENGAKTLDEAYDLWPWKSPQGRTLPPTFAMIACNPDVENHWIYRRFHPESTEWKETYSKRDYKMIEVSSRENCFLPDQNLNEMLNKDTSFINRFVDGKWGIPEGQIHKLDPLSVIEGDFEIVEYIRRNCTLHRALDHGDAAPTCCLWYAVDREGNVFFYREYYMPNKLVSDHRSAITELSKEETYRMNVADPSIFYKTQQKYGGHWSTYDEYADVTNLPRETAIFWIAGDNNELGTRNRINEYLRVDPERIHPITKRRGAPRLFFIKKSSAWPQGCYHSILQLKSQKHERIGTDLGKPIFSDERASSIADHAYDPIRYAMASRPPLSTVPGKKYGEWSFESVRQNMLTFKRRGGFRKMQELAVRHA